MVDVEKNRRSRLKKLLQKPHSPQSKSINLPVLLFLVLGSGLLLSILLIYYIQVAINVWTPDFTLPNITPPLPTAFRIESFSRTVRQINDQLWRVGIIVLIFIVIIFQSEHFFKIISIVLSLIFGLTLAGNWTRILPWLSQTSFNQVDPQFQRDLSFYIFSFPIWKLFDFWLGGLFLVALIIVGLTYLLSAKSLSQGKFPGFSRPQLRHLYTLASLMMLIMALRHWLARYQLLYSPRGVVYGASYTDIHVTLLINTSLSFIALGIAIWLFLKAVTGKGQKQWLVSPKKTKLSQLPFSPLPFYLYLGILISGFLLAQLTQYLIVQPNELARERPYIERSIALTRKAFDLDKINIETLAAAGELTLEDLRSRNSPGEGT